MAGLTPPGVHTVYRFYNQADQLLYVGVTNNPERRLIEHADRKSWIHLIAWAEFAHYPTRYEAEEAERRAIENEDPVWNIAGKPGGYRPPPPPPRDPSGGPAGEWPPPVRLGDTIDSVLGWLGSPSRVRFLEPQLVARLAELAGERHITRVAAELANRVDEINQVGIAEARDAARQRKASDAPDQPDQ